MDEFEKNNENNDLGYTYDNTETISYTNAKGYYDYLTKLMLAMSKSRIEGNLTLWFECIDTMFVATFPYWNNKQDIEKFESLYEKSLNMFNNQDKAFSDNIKCRVNSTLKKNLREMNKILMQNTKHMNVKLSMSESDDLDFLED